MAGVWLTALGGSWYYLLAGAALVAFGVLRGRRQPAALWLYAALLIATMAWAVWEVVLDFWALAPRGDVLAILGAVLALPWVVRRLGSGAWPGPAWPLVASLGLAVLVALGAALNRPHDLQGRLPSARGQASPALYAGVPQQDWSAYGRSWRGDRWSPVNQITSTNAAKLEQVWEFHTGDCQREGNPDEFTYEVTPIKLGGLVYLYSPHNIVFALDAETGREVWRYNPNIRASKQMQHPPCRGVSYLAPADRRHRDSPMVSTRRGSSPGPTMPA